MAMLARQSQLQLRAALRSSSCTLRARQRHASSSSEGEVDAHGGRKPMINFDVKSRLHDQQPGQPHPCAPPEIMKEFGSFGSPERQREIAERASASASGTQNQGQKSPNPGPTTQKQSPPPASPSSDRAPSRSSSSSASSSSSSSKPPSGAAKGLPPVDYEEFFEAPKRYWTQPPLEDAEMEAVMTGGATSVMKHI